MKHTLLLLFALIITVSAGDVSFKSLLTEMVNRDELAKLPKYSYTLGQASSYDRASKSPSQGWFANSDGGGFIRTENINGRSERILMDKQGPGAIVRFWSTYLPWKFSNGTLRFYFDGATQPQIEGKFLDIISGSMLVDGVLSKRTGGFREDNKGQGHTLSGVNMYLPLPYAKSCKVTYEGTDNPFYFAINFRKFSPETTVETVSLSTIRANKSLIDKVQKNLELNPFTKQKTKKIGTKDKMLKAGESANYSIKGTRAIRSFLINLEAKNHPQALRSTIIEIKFDGESKVFAPVGDFFGIGYILKSEINSRYHRITLDGDMQSLWLMPFQKEAQIIIHNRGQQDVKLKKLLLQYSAWKWDSRSLYFHADWRHYYRIPAGPHRDLNYVTIQGQGKYVGDSLSIFNEPSGKEGQPWWGEGDEKIYVDGETFPSNFGTGTEDYYGYAWVGCALFSEPFLSQPIADGNRGIGLTVNNRWRSLDTMPFNKSLKLDMELWHWVGKANVDYAPTTFWYGTKETKAVKSFEDTDIHKKRVEAIKTAQEQVRVTSRIEAEAFKVYPVQGVQSVVYTQPTNRAWSNRSQLLFTNVKAGQKLITSFFYGSDRAGKIRIVAQKLANNMTVDLHLNGKLLVADLNLAGHGTLDIIAENGHVKKGKNLLVIRAKSGGSEVSLDYIELVD